MIFTDEIIDELISCQKYISEAPKSMNATRGSDKIKFSMSSINGEYNFTGFISKNQTFQENFSVGLVYNPKDEKDKIVLLRVNGPHGLNENAPHHDGPHVHISTAERINSGLKPEGKIETDVPYATIEDAIQYYLKRVNLDRADCNKYFPGPDGQINLNFDDIDQ